MIKVYGFRRSGNHLLMASLWQNFQFPEEGRLIYADGLRWYADGATEAHVPWAGLFGGHIEYSADECSPEHAVYIVRHPVDCLYSHWRGFGAGKEIQEHITRELIREWRRHVESYSKQQIFLVRYERLATEPLAVLEEMERRFGLQRRQAELRPVEGPVGCSPGEGARQKPPLDGRSLYDSRLPQVVRVRFLVVLGPMYMNYVL